MPSHKMLKSVVRGLAESFTSLMNYEAGDYIMGHVVSAAWASGATELRVDLLTGATNDFPLLIEPVRNSVARYVERLPELLRRSDSDLRFVVKSELVVTVDPTRRRAFGPAGIQESPFTCTVRIVDERVKTYEHHVAGWWYPERVAPVPRGKPWWRFW